MMDRRGTTLLELMLAVTIGGGVITTGCVLYTRLQRADKAEARRELTNAGALSLLSRMKSEVRSASSVTVSANSLVVNAEGARITYRNVPGGLERNRNGAKSVVKNLSCGFRPRNGGAEIVLRSHYVTDKRPVGVELTTFVRPRNAL